MGDSNFTCYFSSHTKHRLSSFSSISFAYFPLLRPSSMAFTMLLLLFAASFLHSTTATPFRDQDQHLKAEVLLTAPIVKAPTPPATPAPAPPVAKQPPPPLVKKPTPSPATPAPAPPLVKQPPPPVVKKPTPSPAPVVKPPTSPAPPVVKPPTTPAPPLVPAPAPSPVVKKPPTAAPPLPPVRSKADCIPLCGGRCKLHSRKNVCVRACVTCCDRCKCVPPGTYGNRELCGSCYTDMTSHGKKNKCP